MRSIYVASAIVGLLGCAGTPPETTNRPAATTQAGIGTSFFAGNPTLTLDGRTIYCASTRPERNGGSDIWTARQSASLEGFTDIRHVPELATSFEESPLYVSRDGCRLYFQSNRAGLEHIFVAEKSL
jgi:hypothetical protein